MLYHITHKFFFKIHVLFMKKKVLFSLVISWLLLFNRSYSQISLTEIMFDPSLNENYYEFIEIYNNSESESIDLTDWSISDGYTVDTIIGVAQGIVLAPRQFAIILDQGYFDNIPVYDELIPDDALVLTIDGSTFGNSGLSNSTPETVSLFDSDGHLISQYTYSLDNISGHSDEKIDLSGPNSPDNWANSKTEHGTPGFWNSVSPLNFDLSVTLDFYPNPPAPGAPFSVSATIVNIGLKSVSDFSVSVYNDLNQDSVGTTDELIFQENNITENLMSGDSVNRIINVGSFASGEHTFIAYIDIASDMNLTNNQDIKSIIIPFNKNTLIINEVMFNPNTNGPEWIELYNPSEHAIDLANWKISDSTDTKVPITDQPMQIQPNEFLILSQIKGENSFTTPHIYVNNWPALNNDFDAVVLYDLTTFTIDSMIYFDDWNPEKGVSLERFDDGWPSTDSMNWAPSKAPSGSTPGMYNSISPKDYDLKIDNITFTNPNSGTDESILISASVTNVGKQHVDGFTVSFYNDVNNDSLLEDSEKINDDITNSNDLNRFDSVTVTVEWDNIPAGIQYVAARVFSSQDQNSENDETFAQYQKGFLSQSIVINEIMYAPLTDANEFMGEQLEDQPEWIELYNRSEETIDLQNWSFSDSDTASRFQISNYSLKIQPDSFLIIADFPLSAVVFPNIPAPVVVTSQFPSLNNTSDAVYLYDLNHNIIDHLVYSDDMGGGDGYSLERFNPEIASDDINNWSSCTKIEGGTPGARNSIFVEKLATSAAVKAAPNPFSPDIDGITIIHYNLPLKTAAINIKIYDTRGRLRRYLANNQPSGNEGSIIWDGKDDDAHQCRMGIYIIFLEALNSEQGVLVSHKSTVVLAGKL